MRTREKLNMTSSIGRLNLLSRVGRPTCASGLLPSGSRCPYCLCRSCSIALHNKLSPTLWLDAAGRAGCSIAADCATYCGCMLLSHSLSRPTRWKRCYRPMESVPRGALRACCTYDRNLNQRVLPTASCQKPAASCSFRPASSIRMPGVTGVAASLAATFISAQKSA